ncbi:coq1 putative hexaprenyl diphosphate synthase [Hypoxylon texense]
MAALFGRLAIGATWILATLLSHAVARDPFTNFTVHPDAADATTVPKYSPLRPPAIPLAVRTPYTSAWSTTSQDGTLSNQNPIFWFGQGLGWQGIVVVDGNSFEYMGRSINDFPELSYFNTTVPLEVKFDSQFSNFTFLAGPVIITASFFSPVTPKDICRSSIPLSYLTTTVQSSDGKPHHVQFYSDVNAQWIGFGSEYDVIKELHTGPSSNGTGPGNLTDSPMSWILRPRYPVPFAENTQIPRWGNFSYTTSPKGAEGFSFQSGSATSVRFGFINNRVLNNDAGSVIRGFGNQEPVYAFAHDMGTVLETSVRYTIGSIQSPNVRYLHKGGLSDLAPWWEKCYGGMHDMISFHYYDFDTVAQLGNEFESQLRADVNTFFQGGEPPVYGNRTPVAFNNNSTYSTLDILNGTDQYGQQYEFDPDSGYGYLGPGNATGIAVPFVSEADSYYAIVALSARQVMGAYVFAVPPGATGDAVEPLMFQKEISSNGNMNTVDVLYPASPFFLYANPALLKYIFQPLYELQEGGFYPNSYSTHDIGAHFPLATGHVEGTDEYMPVENSGNSILMSYAYYKFTGDTAWLTSHYAILKQFAQYLIDYSLVPEAQLSTDDFAGELANQTNLAIKGIVGLQAMSAVARVVGNAEDAAAFATKATDYYEQWEGFAIDPSGRHTLLAYQWRSSWGLLYNVYFDKLLNMGLVRPELYDMQSAWYAGVSQTFGVPLDNRHHYTKSDWEIWTAATCSRATRRLFVNAVAYWLNETVTNLPFADLHEVVGAGDYPLAIDHFSARPVVGGHFALLALGKTGQLAGATGGDTTGSLFPKNGTEHLPVPERPYTDPSYAGPSFRQRAVRKQQQQQQMPAWQKKKKGSGSTSTGA